MGRATRVAAGIGGLLVTGALGVTVAAATAETGLLPARAATASLAPAPVAPLTGNAVAASGGVPRAVTTPSGPVSSGTQQVGPAQDGSFASFAAALGVDEATLRAALAGAHADVRAARPSSGGTQARAALVTALATRLGKPETQVRTAFQAFLAAHQVGSRDALTRRLDAAVAAGRITQAERAAILKAYDAGVLGRGAGAAGRMGHLSRPGAAVPTGRA